MLLLQRRLEDRELNQATITTNLLIESAFLILIFLHFRHRLDITDGIIIIYHHHHHHHLY